MHSVGKFAPFVAPDAWLARSPEEIPSILDVWGVCVVRMISGDESAELVTSLFDDIRDVTGGEVDLAAAKYEEFYDIFEPKNGMLLQHHGIGHLPTLHRIRQHPVVEECFKRVWPGQRLASSFDGCSIHVPLRRKGTMETSKSPGCLHTDQSLVGNRCVQGLVNLKAVHPGDATFACIPGGHRYHKDVSGSLKKDWHRYSPDDIATFVSKGLSPVAFLLLAGDIVLWDSRTPHAGFHAYAARESSIRVVAYVCKLPLDRLTEKDKRRRRAAFSKGKTSTHDGNHYFPDMPRSYGKPSKRIKVTPLPIDAESERLYGL